MTDITIITVNWYSGGYIAGLLDNLAQKAAEPTGMQALIVDNTNGKDAAVNDLKTPLGHRVIPFDGEDMKSSAAHAAALDYAMGSLETEYTLVIDPDVYVFKKDWDKFCINELRNTGAAAVGAPYPGWKLGKYHNFPSPVFCFFRTRTITDLKTAWTPFSDTKAENAGVFVLRQTARLCGLFTRENYVRCRWLQRYAAGVEKLFGTFSRDTGWRIAKEARRRKIKSVAFETAMPQHIDGIPAAANADFQELMRQYELYIYKRQLILTHKYGTGVYLWKTKRGADKKNWLGCAKELDSVITRADRTE